MYLDIRDSDDNMTEGLNTVDLKVLHHVHMYLAYEHDATANLTAHYKCT